MSAKSDLKSTHAMALLEALQHVTTPVVINVIEIAERKGAKINTIQKQLSTIKKLYNINIQTTTVSAASAGTGGPVTPPTNRVTKPRAAPAKRTPKKQSSKKVAVDLTDDDGGLDEGGLPGLKTESESKTRIKKEEDREADEEEASTIRANSVYQQPTPKSPLSFDGDN